MKEFSIKSNQLQWISLLLILTAIMHYPCVQANAKSLVEINAATVTSNSCNINFGSLKSLGTTLPYTTHAFFDSTSKSNPKASELIEGQVDHATSDPDEFKLYNPLGYWYAVWANDGGSADINISIATTGHWLGHVSSDWHIPANWYGGLVPGATMDVNIAPGYTYHPIVSVLPGNCNSLKIATGATLEVDGTNLNVATNVIIHGTVNLNSGVLDAAWSIFWESGSTGSSLVGSVFELNDTWWFKPGANVQLNSGGVHHSGSGISALTCKLLSVFSSIKSPINWLA